ncbi:MAG: hypothetical protein N2319_02420 [Candidatus Kapabacteria bacterium]|nr:hypothetical protein [Candidatus Kapabacteria bacterium]
METSELNSESIKVFYKESELNTLPQMFTNLIYSIKFYCDIIPINLLEIITDKLNINMADIHCLNESEVNGNNCCQVLNQALKEQCKVRTIEVLCEIRKFFLLLHFFSMTNTETCIFFLNQIESLQNEVLRNCKY